jgi:rubrerythrin
MRLVDLLSQCAELEIRIGELYQAFALRWHADSRLASFWSGMASEERHHASVLSAAAALAHEKEDLREAADPRSFASIRGFVLALTSYPAPTTVDDALRTALELEELELDRVHTELVRLSGLEAAGADDEGRAAAEEHVEQLLAMIERCATDEGLRRRVEANRRNREAAPPASVEAALRAISRRLWGAAERPSGTAAQPRSPKTRPSTTRNRGGDESDP